LALRPSSPSSSRYPHPSDFFPSTHLLPSPHLPTSSTHFLHSPHPLTSSTRLIHPSRQTPSSCPLSHPSITLTPSSSSSKARRTKSPLRLDLIHPAQSQGCYRCCLDSRFLRSPPPIRSSYLQLPGLCSLSRDGDLRSSLWLLEQRRSHFNCLIRNSSQPSSTYLLRDSTLF